MNYYLEREKLAVENLKKLLALPVPDENNRLDSDDEFDPWRITPGVFGTYSAAFDNMALEVLTALQRGDVPLDETLAHEMYREMLCTADLCDYGTSPRCCFPSAGFKELLPALIDKWRDYYRAYWGEEPRA